MRTTVWWDPSKRTKAGSVRYYDPVTGKPRRIYCEDKYTGKDTMARTRLWLRSLRSGLGQGGYVNPLVAFKEYIDSMKFTHRPSTIQIKQESLTKFLERYFQLNQITKAECIKWQSEMSGKYKIDSISIKLRELRAFLNWCIREKKIDASPMQGIKIPESTEVGHRITDTEMESILAALDDDFRPLFQWLRYTGCRVGEMLKADFKDLSEDLDFWTIPKENCKTKITRTIPLHPILKTELQKRDSRSGRVFPEWNKHRIRNKWKFVLRRSGIKERIRVHDIRHTFASEWRGLDRTLEDVCGWRSDTMRRRYTHIKAKEARSDLLKTFGVDLEQLGPKSPEAM